MRTRLLILALVSGQTVLANEIQVDGKLDEAAWQGAAIYRDFYQVVPATLMQTQNKVEGRAFATADGIYIGFKNWQKQGERKKQYNLQDAFMQADFNRFVIDFSGDGSGAYQFAVTLGGGVQDAVLTPQLTTDADWDGIWQSAFYEYKDYWSSEVFIPWHSVSFKPNRTNDGMANVGVSLQLYELATNHIYASQPQTTSNSDFYLKMPKIQASIPEQQQWAFIPYATHQQDFVGEASNTDMGFDLVFKPDHHQKLSLAVNPDFGQVDSDELDLNYSTVETLVTDKRPFFTQDIGVMNVNAEQNTKLVHTRRIGAGSDDGQKVITPIDGAVRLIHQGDNWQFAGFAALEEELDSGAGKDFYVGRARYREDTWQSGVLVTHTERPWRDRNAQTAAWDSQYQSDTWSWQSALLASAVTERGEDSQGYGVSTNIKYQFDPNTHLTGRYLRLDDEFDNNDLGYRKRNNWRFNELYFSHAVNYSSGFINRIQHNVQLNYESNDSGLKLPATQSYWASFILADGSSFDASFDYQTAGWDDLIGAGLGQYENRDLLKSWFFYGSPYTGSFSWAASFRLDQEGIDGLAQQYAVDMTWMPHENWSLKFNNFYRQGDGMVIASGPGQVAEYDRRLFANYINVSGLLSDKLELSMIFQWAILDADTKAVYDIRGHHLSPVSAVDNSFTDQRFTSQIKLRYRLGAYSDIYVVYNRGAGQFDQDVGSKEWLSELNSMWQQREQDQLTFKVRYLF